MSRLEEATRFLSNLLASGDLLASGVRSKAAAHGFAWRTVERAASALGIEKHKAISGWWWGFPKTASPPRPPRPPTRNTAKRS